MVAMCLVKDQTKRPTAEKLLKHSFFKNAKPPELSMKKLFADLPPLWNRVKALQVSDHTARMQVFYFSCPECLSNVFFFCPKFYSLKMLHN